jgi:hypothetical protein
MIDVSLLIFSFEREVFWGRRIVVPVTTTLWYEAYSQTPVLGCKQVLLSSIRLFLRSADLSLQQQRHTSEVHFVLKLIDGPHLPLALTLQSSAFWLELLGFWTVSKNLVILSVTHHRQEPSRIYSAFCPWNVNVVFAWVTEYTANISLCGIYRSVFVMVRQYFFFFCEARILLLLLFRLILELKDRIRWRFEG